MKDIPLSMRLKTVADYIPKGSILADIGSDHAYLPCYAYLNGLIKKAVAGEVNEGPLRSARETIEKYGLASHISARLGDGLSVIEKGEVNVVTICGMGGELIKHILESGKDRLTEDTLLILQPNVAERHVRAWLMNEGWTIVDEVIMEEDSHIYEIIVGERRRDSHRLTDVELMFGPKLIHNINKTFIKKWQSELKKRERVIHSLRSASPETNVEERRQAIEAEMNMIKEVLL
ncbi:MAG: tRNA (adenine(22)-N(1))-methyltransferase [Tuberibacillus sp.]